MLWDYTFHGNPEIHTLNMCVSLSYWGPWFCYQQPSVWFPSMDSAKAPWSREPLPGSLRQTHGALCLTCRHFFGPTVTLACDFNQGKGTEDPIITDSLSAASQPSSTCRLPGHSTRFILDLPQRVMCPTKWESHRGQREEQSLLKEGGV